MTGPWNNTSAFGFKTLPLVLAKNVSASKFEPVTAPARPDKVCAVRALLNSVAELPATLIPPWVSPLIASSAALSSATACGSFPVNLCS